ncbi:formate dehydrogenase-O, major subunit [Escherichia coli]|uniref:Formate dehydrogenase-O, major subunit n=1 Tax=Escherichia coli TaxID=562 RepID=A0A376UA24_ECOLX|nr:formate dehydrogenase-O, major subunit [Escherichia coli]
MIQLLLVTWVWPVAGVNALRGHSNIQGLTDLVSLYQPARLSDAAVRKTG